MVKVSVAFLTTMANTVRQHENIMIYLNCPMSRFLQFLFFANVQFVICHNWNSIHRRITMTTGHLEGQCCCFDCYLTYPQFVWVFSMLAPMKRPIRHINKISNNFTYRGRYWPLVTEMWPLQHRSAIFCVKSRYLARQGQLKWQLRWLHTKR